MNLPKLTDEAVIVIKTYESGVNDDPIITLGWKTGEYGAYMPIPKKYLSLLIDELVKYSNAKEEVPS